MTANKKKLMCHMASRDREAEEGRKLCQKHGKCAVAPKSRCPYTALHITYCPGIVRSCYKVIFHASKATTWQKEDSRMVRERKRYREALDLLTSLLIIIIIVFLTHSLAIMCDCRLCAIGNKHYWRMYQFTTVKVRPIHAQSMNSSFSFTTHSDSAHIALAKKKLDK